MTLPPRSTPPELLAFQPRAPFEVYDDNHQQQGCLNQLMIGT